VPISNVRRHAGRRGFTLVEVMVAGLIFAFGMMAAVAMQYTALDGFSNTRDLTNASEIGTRLIDVMNLESQQWRNSGDLSSISSVYGGSGYWETGSILSTVNSSSWQWKPVFSQPVDVRFSDGGARRYCAYVRGGLLNDPQQPGSSGMLRVQIAVAYPSSKRVFPGASSGGQNAAPYGLCDGGNLPGSIEVPTGSEPPQHELDGYRAVFMGTVITQRGYLSEGRSRG